MALTAYVYKSHESSQQRLPMNGFETRDIHKKYLNGIEPNLCSKKCFLVSCLPRRISLDNSVPSRTSWKVHQAEILQIVRNDKFVKLEMVFGKDRPWAAFPGYSKLCSPWSRRLPAALPSAGGWVMLLDGDILQHSRSVI